MSLELLKSCLQYDFYNKHKSLLTEEFFPSEVKKIYHTLEEHYQLNQVDITSLDLQKLYISKYPALTSSERNNVATIFTNLDKVVISAEVANSILKVEKLKHNATLLANEALNVADGKHRDFAKIKGLCKALEKEYSDTVDELTPVTDDLDELLELGKEEQKWKFPLDNFNEKLGGIGPAVFVHIAARPNAGKTASLVSLIFHPKGWAAQGAKVALFCNEEEAHRTKKRGITCYTGYLPSSWRENKEAVKKKWAEIKSNILVYDVVGMSISEIESWLDEHRPDIIVLDQIDKVKVPTYRNKAKHEDIRDLYTEGRELGKKYRCAVVGTGQASAEAEDKLHYGFDMLEHSKTGKAAECDLIITIGKESLDKMPNKEDTGFRQANIVKNKLTGWEGVIPFMLNRELSRMYQ